jgi:3',5'-cyclic AMP phosphodiesterase CpdA
MLTILHGSDLHFGKHLDPEGLEAFRGAVEASDPDLVVLSGDFTQRAKVGEYRQARKFLDGLGERPVMVTPGNHDVPLYRVWERVFSPFRNYQEHIRRDLDETFRIPGATVVSLNSAEPYRAIVNGRIGRRQLAFAAEAFRGSPERDLKIVVTHHNLSPAPDNLPEQVLPLHRTYLRAFREMGVELVLGGHLHRAYMADAADVLSDRSLDPGPFLVYSGTSSSHRGRGRERGRNSYNFLTVSPDRIEVVHMVRREGGAFEPYRGHTLQRVGYTETRDGVLPGPLWETARTPSE